MQCQRCQTNLHPSSKDVLCGWCRVITSYEEETE